MNALDLNVENRIDGDIRIVFLLDIVSQNFLAGFLHLRQLIQEGAVAGNGLQADELGRFEAPFVADRFVVCSFVPRPFETDPGAIKVPFFHNNDDYDEVIFYHAGDFFSRDGIRPGMVTFHPCGFTHGPHPGALSRTFVQPKPMTDEYAVMIDTRDALDVGPGATACENPDYAMSWRARDGSIPAAPRIVRPSGDAP